MKIEIGKRDLSIETDKLAGTADGACIVRYGETVVLVTVCKDIKPSDSWSNFLPLTCDYLERKYAAGRIPGGFFKREGKPTEKEILTSRLIDRPIRPLFPETWKAPTQIVGTVLSSDIENDGDILGIIGASYALRISSIPFQGPIGAVRIGLIQNGFVVNPTTSELEDAELNLVVAGTESGITMIEANCKEVKEEVIISALEFALPEIHKLIEFQKKVKDGTEEWEVPEYSSDELKTSIQNIIGAELCSAFQIPTRTKRREKIKELRFLLIKELQEKYEEHFIINELEQIERDIVRKQILDHNTRIDGRGVDELRPISCEISVLPRAHGSALFTKGETQSLCTVTLGTGVDEQKIDELIGESYKSFMVHYNFPPFSVGEVSPLRAPGRREIGHGALAEKALESILPSTQSFPYTIRIVADILSSNGSSSMATVCGGTLALMDAGILIKSHVAGVGLGLVDHVVLVDAIGEEDHFGDMDFKIAGTKDGITAIQLDIKTKGLSIELIKEALRKGKEARLKILDRMNETISSPKKEISIYAPKLTVIEIPKDKIGLVIGPGGKVIREIIEKTGAKIEIAGDGKITISSDQWKTTEAAKKIIEGLVREIEVGRTYLGKVKKILPFGVIIELLPGKEGMIHISQLAHYRVRNPEDVVKVGEEVPVKVIEIDEEGKIQLSRKALIHR
jgi:polyribonucleotide nucleotidyltransferase